VLWLNVLVSAAKGHEPAHSARAQLSENMSPLELKKAKKLTESYYLNYASTDWLS
jgi:hypothetical protein